LTQISANRLRGIGIITDKGIHIGQLRDIVIDETNGKILALSIKLSKEVSLQGLNKDDSGNPMIPFSAVLAMRDYIVVNERALTIQLAKTRQPAQPVQAAIPTAPLAPPSPPPSAPKP
jgi:sporulation protein YlmC with PRC-barrel domain